MRRFFSVVIAASAMLVAAPAAADGLAASANDLPVAARAKLQADIQAYRASKPQAFAAVRDVQGYRPKTYRQFRNPVPLVGRELRSLGKSALLPMLNALAFEAPPMAGVTEPERRALIVGMLEAVGTLRDARSAAVVAAVFERQSEVHVSQSAAEALGQLCSDDTLSVLTVALDTSKRTAAIHGVGQCRKLVAARVLAGLLDASAKSGEAEVIAAAMGRLGSSWAWRALGESRASEGSAARTLMTEALVRNYHRFGAEVQTANRRSLSMIEHPQIRSIVAKQTASGAVRRGLDAVVTRVEKRARR